MLKFHVQEYERCARYIMPACSIVAGRHIDQTFAIIDLKGAPPASLGQALHRGAGATFPLLSTASGLCPGRHSWAHRLQCTSRLKRVM